jgi:hypothetical protein
VDYDQVLITGNATLRGALNVSLVGAFRPVPGDAFEVLRFSSSSGTFDSISGLDIGGGLYLQPIFNATNLVLSTVDTRPQPVFELAMRLPDGNTKFRLTNIAGQSFVLQATPNLSQIAWTPVLTNTNSGAIFEFIDEDTGNHPERYFRAMLLP